MKFFGSPAGRALTGLVLLAAGLAHLAAQGSDFLGVALTALGVVMLIQAAVFQRRAKR